MDPNTNRAEQLKIAARIIEATDNDRPLYPDNVVRLAELVIALDEWLSQGGFLPTVW